MKGEEENMIKKEGTEMLMLRTPCHVYQSWPTARTAPYYYNFESCPVFKNMVDRPDVRCYCWRRCSSIFCIPSSDA